MSLVKKTDVKNHLSPHHQKAIHLCAPLSQPDATGLSGDEPERTDSNMQEQHQQPSTGLESPSLVTSPDSGSTFAPTMSKSAQG
jgi:hypothetical protein